MPSPVDAPPSAAMEPYRSILRTPSARDIVEAAPPAPPSGPTGPPAYLEPTDVQPKGHLQDYPNVDAETIRNAFSPNAMACGIRTLPNALAPDFRSKLMEEVISRSKYFFSHGHGHPSLPSGSYFEEPVTAFGSPPRKEHPLNNTFSMYRYEPSPYNAARVAAQQHRRTQAWRYGDSEFKVAVPPMPVGAQTAFNSYEYPHEPYTKMVRDIVRSAGPDRSKVVSAKPFMPAGHVANVHMERCLGEVLAALAAHFGRDWPRSFEQAFEDVCGGVVVAFNRQSVASEGDITTYMNHWANHSDMVRKFKLYKDIVRWGVYDPEHNWVGYMMWPQWVKHRPQLPEELLMPFKTRPLTSEYDVVRRQEEMRRLKRPHTTG